MPSWGAEALKRIGIWPMFSPDDLPRLRAVHAATEGVYREADLLLLSVVAVERPADFTDDPDALRKLAWVRAFLRGLLDAWQDSVNQAIRLPEGGDHGAFEAAIAADAAIPATGSLLKVMDPTEWGQAEIRRRIAAAPGREQVVGLLTLHGLVLAIEAQTRQLSAVAARILAGGG